MAETLKQHIADAAEALKSKVTQEQLTKANEALTGDPSTMPRVIMSGLDYIRQKSGLKDNNAEWDKIKVTVAGEFIRQLASQTEVGQRHDTFMQQEGQKAQKTLLDHPAVKPWIKKITKYMSWPEFAGLIMSFFKLDPKKPGAGQIVARFLKLNKSPDPAPTNTPNTPAEGSETAPEQPDKEYVTLANTFKLHLTKDPILTDVKSLIDTKGNGITAAKQVPKFLKTALETGRLKAIREATASVITGNKSVNFRFLDLNLESSINDAQQKQIIDIITKGNQVPKTVGDIRKFLDRVIKNPAEAIKDPLGTGGTTTPATTPSTTPPATPPATSDNQ